jgi:hypothetical protein
MILESENQMISAEERINRLLAVAYDQPDTEEGRTTAILALKAIKAEGFRIVPPDFNEKTTSASSIPDDNLIKAADAIAILGILYKNFTLSSKEKSAVKKVLRTLGELSIWLMENKSKIGVKT